MSLVWTVKTLTSRTKLACIVTHRGLSQGTLSGRALRIVIHAPNLTVDHQGGHQ